MDQLPYVTISYAQSLDGRLATLTGDSQWIGGPESLRFAHELRRDNDGILVGIGTVLKDNPQLTCRIEGGKNPIRIVLDRQLRIPLDSKLVQTISQAPVWVFTSAEKRFSPEAEELEKRGVKIFLFETLQELLHRCVQEGIKSVFVEGGSKIITSFLKERLVDRMIVVTAPILIGKGIEAVDDLEIRTMRETIKAKSVKRWSLGQDEATLLIFSEPLPEEMDIK